MESTIPNAPQMTASGVALWFFRICTLMRWLQLRFDFDSTAVRLIIIRRQGHSKVARAAVTLTYLFRSHKKYSSPHTVFRLAVVTYVGRQIVVARSNCNGMGVERQSNRICNYRITRAPLAVNKLCGRPPQYAPPPQVDL